MLRGLYYYFLALLDSWMRAPRRPFRADHFLHHNVISHEEQSVAGPPSHTFRRLEEGPARPSSTSTRCCSPVTEWKPGKPAPPAPMWGWLVRHQP